MAVCGRWNDRPSFPKGVWLSPGASVFCYWTGKFVDECSRVTDQARGEGLAGSRLFHRRWVCKRRRVGSWRIWGRVWCVGTMSPTKTHANGWCPSPTLRSSRMWRSHHIYCLTRISITGVTVPTHIYRSTIVQYETKARQVYERQGIQCEAHEPGPAPRGTVLQPLGRFNGVA